LPDGWTAEPPPAPVVEPDPETVKRTEIFAIENELTEIDRKSIRPLRALVEGAGSNYDREKLAELEAQAAALRTRLVEPRGQNDDG
jgi:hypothetical protein